MAEADNQPTDILKAQFTSNSLRYADAAVEISTHYKSDAAALHNLRPSEAKEYAKQYLIKVIDHMQLPESVAIFRQDSDSMFQAGTVKIVNPDIKTAGENTAWVGSLKPVFEAAKTKALAEMGDFPLHNHAGEALSGAHTTRAKASKTKGPRQPGN